MEGGEEQRRASGEPGVPSEDGPYVPPGRRAAGAAFSFARSGAIPPAPDAGASFAEAQNFRPAMGALPPGSPLSAFSAETSEATPSPDELLQENAALKAELAALKQTLAQSKAKDAEAEEEQSPWITVQSKETLNLTREQALKYITNGDLLTGHINHRGIHPYKLNSDNDTEFWIEVRKWLEWDLKTTELGSTLQKKREENPEYAELYSEMLSVNRYVTRDIAHDVRRLEEAGITGGGAYRKTAPCIYFHFSLRRHCKHGSECAFAHARKQMDPVPTEEEWLAVVKRDTQNCWVCGLCDRGNIVTKSEDDADKKENCHTPNCKGRRANNKRRKID